MKTEWLCRWDLIPLGKKFTAAYSSQAKAREAMAKVLRSSVDLHQYIRALRKEPGGDCAACADFLEAFLTDLTMPETESELPDCCDVPEHCVFEFDSCDGFRWSYGRGECPYLSAGFVYEGKENEPYVISFNYENPASRSRDRLSAVEIRITKQISYGSSAYPLMVLFTLGEEPRTQEQLLRGIYEAWDTVMERKAVGRHLQLLRDLGYPVRHGPEGYFLEGEKQPPKPGTVWTPSAYALLVMDVTEEDPGLVTQGAVIRAIREKYGVTVGRKAVGKHRKLLQQLTETNRR